MTNQSFWNAFLRRVIPALVFTAAVVAVAPSLWSSAVSAQTEQPRPARPPQDAPVPKQRPADPKLAAIQSKAFRDGGLEAAAKITGSAVRNVAVGFSGRPYGVEDLLQQSPVVWIGRPLSNRSLLTKDGRDIMLEYRLPVTYAIKGAMPKRDVSVVIRGGRVSFPDGSWAQVNTPGFIWPLSKHEYVWFLRPASGEVYRQLGRGQSEGLLYEPVYGPLGVYSLTTEYVKPSGGRGSPLASHVLRSRMSRNDFLRWVEEAVRVAK